MKKSVAPSAHAVARPVAPSAGYRPDIDGLRAVAVLLVIAFHFTGVGWGPIKRGLVGVDIFFVISGFLITSIIVKDLQHNNFSFFVFYGRRVRRIFPSLLALLITCMVVFYFAVSIEDAKELMIYIMGGVFFIYNFLMTPLAPPGLSVANALGNLWSLAVEEQFYIVWPLLLYLFYKIKIPTIVPMVIIWLVSFYFYLVHFDYVSSISRFWELASGGLMALVINDKRIKNALQNKIISNGLSFIGLVLIIMALVKTKLMVELVGVNYDNIKIPIFFTIFGSIFIIIAGGGVV